MRNPVARLRSRSSSSGGISENRRVSWPARPLSPRNGSERSRAERLHTFAVRPKDERMKLRWMGLCMLAAGVAGCALDLNGLSGGCRAPDGGSCQPLPPGACAGTAGPTAVRVSFDGGSFCIDRTEVTNADYDAFLSARGGDVSGQPAVCTWNASFVPSLWPVASTDLQLPVLGVDWCDARAYCAFAGKHLCGRIGGGPQPFTHFDDAATSAWNEACSAGGTRAYPYGNSFDAGICATRTGSAQAVGSAPGCEGGEPGLFDMSGNAEEWVDSCAASSPGDAGAQDPCLAVGGSFRDRLPGELSCSGGAGQLQPRSARDPWRGLRCCSE